uniref:Uncharacterized protein n=1 Tax=Arundo donax TaxID=35708 RepID=A0A0A8YBW5_ARUDO
MSSDAVLLICVCSAGCSAAAATGRAATGTWPNCCCSGWGSPPPTAAANA